MVDEIEATPSLVDLNDEVVATRPGRRAVGNLAEERGVMPHYELHELHRREKDRSPK
jgi:hypothetical protein